MSGEASSVSIATKGKASVWTEEAKYELLLRVIHQLKQGRPINWSGIRMKGRNTKSLTNAWTRINKDMAELEDLDEGSGGGVKTGVKKTPTKRKTAAVVKEEEGEGGDEDGSLESTPVKKRGRVTTIKKEQEWKRKEKEEEEAEEADAVKKEESDC